MDQVKFFKGCLPQILLSSILEYRDPYILLNYETYSSVLLLYYVMVFTIVYYNLVTITVILLTLLL